MRRLPIAFSLLALLSLVVAPAHAQQVTSRIPGSAERHFLLYAADLHWASPAAALTPSYSIEAVQESSTHRPAWLYPAVGAVAGAVVGGVWGAYDANRSDYISPPPYLVTAPLGAAVGLLAGVLANVIDRR